MALKRADVQLIKKLYQARHNRGERERLLEELGPEIHKVLREVSVNVLKGKVPLTGAQRKALARHKTLVRSLSVKRTPVRERVRVVRQRGGFLLHLLGPLIGMLASKFLK
jgi:hypothetical protein